MILYMNTELVKRGASQVLIQKVLKQKRVIDGDVVWR